MAHLPSSSLKLKGREDDPNEFKDKSWSHWSETTIDGRHVWHMCFPTGSMYQFLDLALYAEAVCPNLVGAVVKHMLAAHTPWTAGRST